MILFSNFLKLFEVFLFSILLFEEPLLPCKLTLILKNIFKYYRYLSMCHIYLFYETTHFLSVQWINLEIIYYVICFWVVCMLKCYVSNHEIIIIKRNDKEYDTKNQVYQLPLILKENHCFLLQIFLHILYLLVISFRMFLIICIENILKILFNDKGGYNLRYPIVFHESAAQINFISPSLS